MAEDSLRDKVAIVGVGTTAFGDLYRRRDVQRSAYDLAATAFRDAVQDAGLDKNEIDGLLCCRLPSYSRMADMLGLRQLRLVNSFEGAGRMSGLTVQTAAMAIATGRAATVACLYGNNGRSVRVHYGGEAEEGDAPTASYDLAYGMTSPGAYVAMMYQRYRHLYGVPDGALAPLAINNRRNAAANPNAVMRTPLTEDDYLNSRFIAEPMRLFDYCLINDGGVALILTSAERARDLRKTPVYIKGTAASSDLTNLYTSDDLFQSACQSVANAVYSEAGIGPDEVNCLEVYDNFTPTILFSLEGFGYCKPGTAWEWIRGGRIARDGEKPVNTSGGHTSESYMQGWALHAEAVRQLRGECGERQVPNCEVAQYMCAAPIVNSHILQRG